MSNLDDFNLGFEKAPHDVAIISKRAPNPILERALEDDVARPAARKALTRFGGDEIETLVSTLHRKRMNEDEEVPSSLRRRRSTAVLSNSRVEAALWPELRVFVEEKDSELVVHGARMAELLAPDAEKVNVVASVLRVLRESPWYFKEEPTGCLEARSTCGASQSSNMRFPGAARSLLSDASLTARC